MKKTAGFTLIELVIFIVIMAVVVLGLLMAFNASLAKSVDVETAVRALDLAEGRMELILGQKKMAGFANFTDPCVATPSLGVCSTPAGYNVGSAIFNNFNGDTNFKLITVSVSGDGRAILTSLVGND